jgi:EamA domain-containing membrane protein RarD
LEILATLAASFLWGLALAYAAAPHGVPAKNIAPLPLVFSAIWLMLLNVVMHLFVCGAYNGKSFRFFARARNALECSA